MIEYHYKGYFDVPSTCGLIITANESGVSVILIELNDNPGTSVTNCYKEIATELVNKHPLLKGCSKDKISWYEIYFPGEHDETQDMVKLTWDESTKSYSNQKWTRILQDRRK